MLSLHTQKNKQGFTLVELLVVIAIIGMLAGLLVPAIGNAMTQAKVTAATARLNQMVQSIQNFKGQYGYFPTFITSEAPIELTGTAARQFFDCLSGDASNIHGNRKRIVFMSFNQEEEDYFKTGAPMPMAGANGNIWLAVDYNGDGQIDNNGKLSEFNDPIRADVIVFSLGNGGNGSFDHETSLVTWNFDPDEDL